MVGGRQVHRQAQGEGQGALLPLRGLGPGVSAVERQDQVVTVRPDGGDPAAEVVGAGRRQQLGEASAAVPS